MSSNVEPNLPQTTQQVPPPQAEASEKTSDQPQGDSQTQKKPQQGGPRGNLAALYVGDLAESVNESRLFEVFNSCGAVASIRICRDSETYRSLGYAYVNYHLQVDAVRALENINFARIDNREIRIMWAQPDPSVRKSGVGNIFVKNLDESIDNKTLYDTFSVFGTILSSKVAYNSEGRSLGYGFVHYEDPRSAENAIRRVNKMEIASRSVQVCHFKPSSERNNGQPKFTNVYVKNFPAGLFADKDAFTAFFTQYGPVNSVCFPSDETTGSPVGFGFANFENSEDAQRAISELNGKEPHHLYVARALSKALRRHRLHEKFVKWRETIDLQTAGRNVYVKNLPETVNDDLLRAEFEKFGGVESAKVRADDRGVSKGFGYVLFANPADASSAIKAMHGKMWDDKVIFVTLWQRKHVRQQQLELQVQSNRKFMQPQPFAPAVMGSQAPQIIYPNLPAGQIPPVNYIFQQQPAAVQMQQQRWAPQTPGRSYPVRAPLHYQPSQMRQVAPPPHPQAQQPPQQIPVESASAMEAPTKDNMGELLYKRILPVAGPNTGKITGMFLEMEIPLLKSVWSDDDMFEKHLTRALDLITGKAAAE